MATITQEYKYTSITEMDCIKQLLNAFKTFIIVDTAKAIACKVVVHGDVYESCNKDQ